MEENLVIGYLRSRRGCDGEKSAGGRISCGGERRIDWDM